MKKAILKNFITAKAILYFILLKGSGTWFIEDKPYEVASGDVIIIPPNKRFYYQGCLKQICITSPAWEPQYEHHVRDISL